MQPRVFVSSTCYDLKHIREELFNFIKSHNLDPVMSDKGDVGYSSGIKELDTSCYEAVKSCDMIILIVGSKYGNAASGEDASKFDEYISITRKEFKTAMNNKVPIFGFVESAVLSEYEFYKSNIDNENIDVNSLNFTSVDSTNIFKFIQEIYNLKNVSFIPFSHVSDIEEFMNKQFADMIKQYLETLKNGKQINEMQSAMEEMNSIMKKMDIMMDGVGKSLLEDNKKEYEEILNKQDDILLSNLCDRIEDKIELYFPDEIEISVATEALIDAIKRVLKAVAYETDIKELDIIFKEKFVDTGIACLGSVNDIIPNIHDYDSVYDRIFENEDKCKKLKKLLEKDGLIYFDDIGPDEYDEDDL